LMEALLVFSFQFSEIRIKLELMAISIPFFNNWNEIGMIVHVKERAMPDSKCLA
jgi:hypothetical protein